MLCLAGNDECRQIETHANHKRFTMNIGRPAQNPTLETAESFRALKLMSIQARDV